MDSWTLDTIRCIHEGFLRLSDATYLLQHPPPSALALLVAPAPPRLARHRIQMACHRRGLDGAARRGRRGLPVLARVGGPARRRLARRGAAADAAAGLHQRRGPDRRVRREAARARHDQRGAGFAEVRDPRLRGRALLRAPRRRLAGSRARRDPSGAHRQEGPRRLDHHDAGGSELLPVQRAHLQPEARRDRAGAQDRAGAGQGPDPRAVPEQDLPRQPQLRLRRGLEGLLRQADRGADPRRVRDARGPAQGARRATTRS